MQNMLTHAGPLVFALCGFSVIKFFFFNLQLDSL